MRSDREICQVVWIKREINVAIFGEALVEIPENQEIDTIFKLHHKRLYSISATAEYGGTLILKIGGGRSLMRTRLRENP